MAQQAARKPDSVLDDHSSRRRVTAALQQPTRKFRPAGRDAQPELPALAHRADTRRRRRVARDPCLFGLAPCGVYHAAIITDVRCALTAPFHPYPRSLALPPAVYSLLHWPSLRLEAQIPDVIRHTALRSPDFPPPPDGSSRARQRSSSRLQLKCSSLEMRQTTGNHPAALPCDRT